MNDGLFEIDETFAASLALVVADARVQLLPDSADITILDDDGECITTMMVCICHKYSL